MRVRPTPLVPIGVIIGYMVVVFSVWIATGMRYDDIGDTVETVHRRAWSWLSASAPPTWRSWRPCSDGGSRQSTDQRKVGAGWMWSVPAMLLVGAALNFAATKWDEIDGVGAYALWLAIGTLLVGFSEELMTRRDSPWWARGSMHEKWVWVFSGALFGFIHVPNALFGQDIGPTLQQVVFALRRRPDLLRDQAGITPARSS